MRKLTFEVPDAVWEKVEPLIGTEKQYRNQTLFLNEAVVGLLKRHGIKVKL
jgi:Arc/MetJ-type ribon-helix-helix transcriptional regulator